MKWGIIPTEPYFSIVVGQMVGGREMLKVVSIEREPVGDTYEYHIVCAKKVMPVVDNKEEFGREFVWKTYHKQPDEVQYQVPEGKYDYIKI